MTTMRNMMNPLGGLALFGQQSEEPAMEQARPFSLNPQKSLETLKAAQQQAAARQQSQVGLYDPKNVGKRLGNAVSQQDMMGNPIIGTASSFMQPAMMRYNDQLAALSPDLLKYAYAPNAQKTTGGGDVDRLMAEMRGMGQYGNQAAGQDKQVMRMASDLARYGVQSMSELTPINLPGIGTVYHNTRTGMNIPAEFGSNMGGEGGTYFTLKTGPNGQVTPSGSWTNTSDRDSIQGALTVLGAAAGMGGLGAALGGATGLGAGAGNAMVGAGMGGLQGAASGQGFMKGALMGGLGGAVSYLNPAGQLGVTDPTWASGINSAISGGLKSTFNGGNPLAGMAGGALSGALGEQFGPLGGMAGSYLGSQLASQFGGSRPEQQQALARAQSGYQQPTVPRSNPLGPLGLLNQARQHIQSSGLGQEQKSNVMGGFGRLEDTGRNKFGWTI